MKFVTLNWSSMYPDYKERMKAIGTRTNAWFVSPLLNKVELLPKE